MKEITEMLNDREKDAYATNLRRLSYDDGDYVMYKNMLDFLWPFVIGEKEAEDKEPFCREFTRWNMGLVEKTLYHEHDIPYAQIRRCYQTIADLAAGDPAAGRKQLEIIGTDNFSTDGLAPKLRMDNRGRVFRPMSKLFIIYNFAKYYLKHDMAVELEELKMAYPYAFTVFDDEEHKSHDQFYKEQMEDSSDRIYYPISERVYKIPWGPKTFYLFTDEKSFILL